MIALIGVAIAGLAFAVTSQLGVSTDGSETPSASGAESTVADQGAVSNEQSSEPAGPISGTWAMYWTNVEGNESPAFTITFERTHTGTLEILNDDTETETSFMVEGDRVEFLFTRTMATDPDTVLEESSFLGTLTGADSIVGEWGRQDWECWPDPNAGCRTTPNWRWYPARLVRK